MSRLRVLVESELYTSKLGEIDEIERLDEAIRGCLLAIAMHAEAFPVVAGKRLRLAKTKMVYLDKLIPGLKVWFIIRDEDTVDLQYIEQDLDPFAI